jgi:hypothetical protein
LRGSIGWVQRFTGFKVQRFKVQRFKVQRFKVQKVQGLKSVNLQARAQEEIS